MIHSNSQVSRLSDLNSWSCEDAQNEHLLRLDLSPRRARENVAVNNISSRLFSNTCVAIAKTCIVSGSILSFLSDEFSLL